MNPPVAFDCPDRQPVQLSGSERVLILPDVHIPYHDNSALLVAVKEGKRRKPTTVLLNGDWGDFYSQSPHETNPKKRALGLELTRQSQGLQWLRGEFPKARIIHKSGNHELWWDRYLWSRAPDLVGLPTTTLKAQIDFPGSRIEFVDHLRAIKIGDLLVLHGHEYRFAISNPVNPARGLFLRTKTLSLCSHFHQPSKHSERDGNGRLITTWSTGCLCYLSPDYASRNNWAHGFAFVEIEGKQIDVENLSVINGKACH
jgi:predicted phosphodiesterase